MAVAAGGSFLELLEKSRLLSAEQMAEVVLSAQGRDAAVVAEKLIGREWITRWQADQLCAGRCQFFLGKYKLLELRGRGAMGAVFKAVQPPMGRIVALKVMAKEVLKDANAVARFQREIRSAATLNHPHIVAALDADCVNDTYFLVMEFVEGQDLKEWLKKNGAAPVNWACECIRQAALGLQHAHERHMIHRDIKPGNLLVQTDATTGRPVVKILDMGLARLASDQRDEKEVTHTGQVMGTPDYIAPEQAVSAKHADIRADIFSLGCTLFELLTGRATYTGNNVMEKLMARALQDAPRVSSLRPEVLPTLDAVVAKMLARDVNQRYQTPGEVAAALAPFALEGGAPSNDVTVMIPADSEAATGTWPSGVDATFAGTSAEPTGTVAATVPVFSPPEEPEWSAPTVSPSGARFKSANKKSAMWWGLAGAVLVMAIVAAGTWLARRPDQASQRNSVTKGKGSVQSSSEPETGPIDLIKRIDPKRHYVMSLWRKEGGVLISPDEPATRLQVPFEPPANYDVKLVAERKKGTDMLGIGLIVQGRQVMMVFDAYGRTATGLHLVDGQSVHDNETRYKDRIFVDGRPSVIVCRVRGNKVRVTADGKEILDWRGDSTRLKQDEYWSVPAKNLLYLAAWNTSFHITELKVTRVGEP